MLQTADLKTCHGCQQDKPQNEFHKDKTQKDGYKNTCKKCRSTLQRRARTKPERKTASAEAELISEARRMAIRTLIEAHPKQFRLLVARYKRQLGLEPTLHELKF